MFRSELLSPILNWRKIFCDHVPSGAVLPGAHVVFALMGKSRGRFQAKPDRPTKSLEVEQEVDDGWILLVPSVALENFLSVMQWLTVYQTFSFIQQITTSDHFYSPYIILNDQAERRLRCI